METAIQIIVAGALLLAWIWVLGRPLVASQDRSHFDDTFSGYRSEVLPAADLTPEGSDLLGFEPSRGRRMIEGWKGWLRRPPEVWRRQLLLASILAAVASSLLAIALRTSFHSRFVLLFVLMMLGLVIHLGVAIILGRRMVAANRTAIVVAERARVRPAAQIQVRADQVGAPRPILEGKPADQEAEPAIEVESESAFDLAAELASELDAVEEAGPVDGAAVVSSLIESEWGPESLQSPPVEGEPSGTAPEARSQDRAPEGQAADNGEVDGSIEETEIEAIFRRAAKDEPSQRRRGGQPIHIESQLDDDDFPEVKVVNHP